MYTIDWDATINVFNIFKDVAVGFAALLTARFAYLGLQSWKKKLTGEEEIKIAREGIILSHRLADEINDVRTYASFGGRMIIPSDKIVEEIMGDVTENSVYYEIEKKMGEIIQYMFEHGLKKQVELHDQLRSHATMVEAFLGKEIKATIDDLLQSSKKLLWEFRILLEDKYDKDKINRDYIKRSERNEIIFARFKREDDLFYQEIESKVNIINMKLKKVIDEIE